MRKELQSRLWERSQAWFNYFMAAPDTSEEFKNKLMEKDSLKFYRLPKNTA